MAGRPPLGRRVLGRLRSDSRTAADPRDRASAAVVARAPLAERSHARDRPGTRRRLSSRPGDRPGLGRRGRSRPAPGLAGPTSAGQRLARRPRTDLCRLRISRRQAGFWYRVAVSALRGGPAAPGETEGRLSPPLPLSARRLLHSLRDGRAGSAEALTSDVDGSLRSPAVVTRSTRAIQLAFCAAIPIFFPVVSLAALALYQRLPQTDPPAFALKSTLDRIMDPRQGNRRRPRDGRDDRRAAGDRDVRRRAPARHRRESRNVDAQDSVIPPGRPRAGGTGAGGAPEPLGRGASESGRRRGPPAAQRSAAVGRVWRPCRSDGN